ncbi:undecaprenyldiphospho-muramoylpentapeptide beta-N-acetylglucosaminyltransferase [Vaginisenegalia massiliensis]|uniref:undecaprenyldiphospho-muramoylpentapeptide beta-N-acetylglucosaminyltransferase n=1 Tax=Vaginisenegalia massiliensis TaxID=2058294 RepID=UPI000F53344B|nr:undecaprenyldiphospho-muramoylpentapeptide beta-N-acetylglucosaminyltransferase [Vaginisenegalia massiliensis]
MGTIKRIVLAGGGTGGHIYPALALLDRIKERYPDVEYLYVGTQKGLESQLVPKRGIPFKSVEIQGLKRSLSLENIKAAWLMLSSTQKAKAILREFKPDIVVGTGGYVCAPVLLAASRLGIPTLIHEQNSVAGITNKFLARHVDIIATCFQEVATDFKNNETKIRYTGNPRGQEVILTPKDDLIIQKQFELNPTLPTVLVFGGSRGAPGINQATIQAIDFMKDKPYQLILATGQGHYQTVMDQLKQDLGELPSNCRVVAYIENMPAIFRQIQLVVCRSGATTLTELTALGLPSILIPSPYVTNNHQEHNALALVNHHAAKMIKEDQLDGKNLFNAIDQVLTNPNQLQQMAENAKALGITNSSDLIISAIESIIK